jgi:hypothetical protein
MITQFCKLPIGARFEFRGRRYEKLAASFAGDEERCGNMFQAGTEVCWENTVPPSRPRAPHAQPTSAQDWTLRLGSVPGQLPGNPPARAKALPGGATQRSLCATA